MLVGGGANYIVNESTPEKQAAAWRFAKYLDEPETQAEWAAATGYIPIRKSAVDAARWSRSCGAGSPTTRWRTTSSRSAPRTSPTAGPVIGPYVAGVKACAAR